jgi:Zn-dependent membrane protease YugP
MSYLLALAVLLLLVFGPQWWVARVMSKYHQRPEKNFPGNGGELARHLLDRLNLHEVKVEITQVGDHYDPGSRTVRLTADKHSGRTLTAITTAAHEVGHAIQHAMDDPMLRWRTRLVNFALISQKIGSFLLIAAPLLTVVTRAPSAGMISLLAAFLVMGLNVVVQLVTLPVELDASYKKALPLLQAGYLTPAQTKAAKEILRAAAFTYLSASLAGLLNFWRWFQVLKR